MRRYSCSAPANCPAACSSVAFARSRSTLSALLIALRPAASFQNQLAIEGDADTRPLALESRHRMFKPGRKQIHISGCRRDAMARGLERKLRHGGARPGIVEGNFSRITRL